MARVFATGGSGFLGGALLAKLVARGDDVHALARSEVAAATVARRGATPVHGRMEDEAGLIEAMGGCELVFHVAAINSHCPADPAALFAANVEGTQAVVRAAARAGVRRVVLTSSSATLGEAVGTVGTEASAHRGSYLSTYEHSKVEAERAAFSIGAEEGLEVVALLPSSIQGPGRSTGNGKLIIDYLNGDLRRFVDTSLSVVDVDDCARAHLLAAERGLPGARYVIHGATLQSQQALVLLSEIAGVSHPVRILPHGLVRAAAAAGELAARVRGRTPSMCRARVATILHGHRYDGSLATRELGLEYVSVEQTFRSIVEWARAEGLVAPPPPVL